MAQPTIYKWMIHNFSKVASLDDPTLVLDSKRFTLTGSKFKFHLRFKPISTMEWSNEHCSFGLILDDLGEAKSVDLSYKLWIENTDGSKIVEPGIGMLTRAFSQIGIGWGWDEFVHHDKLYSLTNPFIKHDIAFICCEILYNSSIPSDGTPQLATTTDEKEWALHQEGFTGLCIVEVGDQKFEVEKKRLMAHSIVFDRMFKSGMKEARTGTITLNDTTPTIFQALVKYLHVHNIEDSDEDALGLYFLADKYEIIDLKEKCSQTLIGKLNEDNILDYLIMAFQHNDKMFKQGILDYLADRPGSFKEVMKSEEWSKFTTDDLQLAREIIDEAFKSMNWY